MYVGRKSRLLTAMSRDRQTSGPVGQAGGHGAVQRTLGIEMALFYVESRDDYAFGGGDERDISEEEFVDGAVPSHVGPVLLNMEKFAGWRLCRASHF